MASVKSKKSFWWIGSSEMCSDVYSNLLSPNLDEVLSTQQSDIYANSIKVGQVGVTYNRIKRLKCGSPYISTSNVTGYNVNNLVESASDLDSGRIMSNYFEKFVIYGLGEYYSTANGLYTLTSNFIGNKPTYTIENNTWKIFWDINTSSWKLVPTSTNSFQPPYLDAPLSNNNPNPAKGYWEGQNQNGLSSHTITSFTIENLTSYYKSGNGKYNVTNYFRSERPIYRHESRYWYIWWDANEEVWRLTLSESDTFNRPFVDELYNRSEDVTAGTWKSTDETQSGRGPNSPAPTPTPTATNTVTPTATPTETPTVTPTPTLVKEDVKDIAVGDGYSLILKTTGKVDVVGDNKYGNLATGDKLSKDYIRESKMQDIVKVASGRNHSLFVKSNGSLWSCGRNHYGQLGDGTKQDRKDPVLLESSGVIDVSCTNDSSFYVKSDGKIYGFGYNEDGNLGIGTYENKSKPTHISGDHVVPNMIIGITAESVTLDNGQQKVRNRISRQYHDVIGNFVAYDETKGQVFDFNKLGNRINFGNVFNEVFSSGTFSISMWCYSRSLNALEFSAIGSMFLSKWESSDRAWQKNSFLIYSHGGFISGKDNRHQYIVDESGKSLKLPTNEWMHLVYALENGKLKIYLNGERQRTNNEAMVHELSPSSPRDLVLGALTTHGPAYQYNGKIEDFMLFDRGINETEVKSLYFDSSHYLKVVSTKSDGSNTIPPIKEIRSGSSHTLCLTEDDELYAFGLNDFGQLGSGSNKQNYSLPEKVFQGKVSKFKVGGSHSIILDDRNNLYVTGSNRFGQIGLGPKLKKATSFTDIGKNNITDFAGGTTHSLLVDKKGNLLVTGLNNDGQLGIGNQVNKNLFTNVSENDVEKTFAGGKNSYFVSSSGKLFGMGDNDKFQIADGTPTDRFSPVEVGVEYIEPVVPTPTNTPTPSEDEYDPSVTCKVTLDYEVSVGLGTDNSSWRSETKEIEINVSREQQTKTIEFASEMEKNSESLAIRNLFLSTSQTSRLQVEVDTNIIQETPEKVDDVPSTEPIYTLTEKTYDTNAIGVDLIEQTIINDYLEKNLKATLVSVEDMIQNREIISTLGADKLNSVQVTIDNPSKISNYGGSLGRFRYLQNHPSKPKRTWYVQLGRSGMTHAYNGSHVFSSYNLYIKSYMGSRKYLIKTEPIIQEDTKNKAKLMGTFTIPPININCEIQEEGSFGVPGNIQKIFSNDKNSVDDKFGSSVAMSGNYAIVGSHYDSDSQKHAGSAYFLKLVNSLGNTYSISQKVIHNNPREGDNFGISVDLSGSHAVVGANHGDGNERDSGVAYVYKFSSKWKQSQKLVASDGKNADNFGMSVAIYKNTIVIGAYTHGDKDSGCVYIYKNDNGSFKLTQKLIPTSTDTSNNYFGRSVAIHNDNLVVGAWGDSTNSSKSGMVYFYKLKNEEFILENKVGHPKNQQDAYFGFSVGVYDGTICIGSHGDNSKGDRAGAVFVFRKDKSDWKHYTTLLPDNKINSNHEYGYKVKLHHNRLLVSAFRDDLEKVDAGSCYLYAFDGSEYKKVKRIFADDASEGDMFGSGIALSKDYALIGANGHDERGKDAGCVYTFNIPSNISYTETDPTPTPTPTPVPTDTIGFQSAVFRPDTGSFDYAYGGEQNSGTWYSYYVEDSGEFLLQFNRSKNAFDLFNVNTDQRIPTVISNLLDENYVVSGEYDFSKVSQGGTEDAHRVIKTFELRYNGSSKTKAMSIADDECKLTMYYEIRLKDGENSSFKSSEVHKTKIVKKSQDSQKFTEKMFTLSDPNMMNGDPSLHFVENFKIISGETVASEVRKNGISVDFYEKYVKDEDCQSKQIDCEVYYTYEIPPVLDDCTFGEMPHTPTPTLTPTPTPTPNLDTVKYGVTDQSYDILSIGIGVFRKRINDDYASTEIVPTLLTIEDLIENPEIITTIGVNNLNNAGILCREPSKLSRQLGGTTNEFYYNHSKLRPYYLQIGTSGLIHTYNGKNPFASHNLYIKSWPSKKKYAIKKTGSSLDVVNSLSVQYTSTKPSTYEVSGYKNGKPYWSGKTENGDTAFIWFEDDYWTWNTQFSGNERDRCRGFEKGGKLPIDVSPFVHDPIPSGWKNEGITIIVETDAPRGVNLTDDSLIASWHVSSASIPNTANVHGKPVGLIHFTGDNHFEKRPHTKNIKVSSPNQSDTFILGVEMQENKNPSVAGPPYYYIDSKITNEDTKDFSISFFYSMRSENGVNVDDIKNPKKYAQGVFCYNYTESQFVSMFTLKNKSASTTPNITKYFGNTIPPTGTSLYITGGPLSKPAMLLPNVRVNGTYHVLIKFKESHEQETNTIDKTTFVRTEDSFDFTESPKQTQTSIEKHVSTETHDAKMLTLEDLIANPSLIDQYGTDFFNNVAIKVNNPSLLSHVNFGGSVYNEYGYVQKSSSGSFVRTFYLQTNVNGTRYTYNREHPFKNYNLYLKAWPGSRQVILKQTENEKTKRERLETGTFSITLTDMNSNEKTKTSLSIGSHSFKINWKQINKISFGGGSNSVYAGFRMYDKILDDDEVGKIINLGNIRFNKLGNTYP